MSQFTAAFRLRNQVEELPLAACTTMRVGGPATVLRFDDLDDLAELLGAAPRWLGKGANLLVGPDGVAEPVARLGPAFAHCSIEPDRDGGARVQVGAAHDIGRLVATCVKAGLAGPECLAGVPGTVGGALCMNAGTAHGWTFDFVERVQVVLPGDRRPVWLPRDEVPAVYRASGLPPGTLFLAAVLHLPAGDAAELKKLSSEWRRAKAASQPLTERSAGCIFKNPDPAQPAGRLLDECGCKGLRVGDAEVSRVHANFIVNRGAADAEQVCSLIVQLRRRVYESRGVDLALEVQAWACPPSVHEPMKGDGPA